MNLVALALEKYAANPLSLLFTILHSHSYTFLLCAHAAITATKVVSFLTCHCKIGTQFSTKSFSTSLDLGNNCTETTTTPKRWLVISYGFELIMKFLNFVKIVTQCIWHFRRRRWFSISKVDNSNQKDRKQFAGRIPSMKVRLPPCFLVLCIVLLTQSAADGLSPHGFLFIPSWVGSVMRHKKKVFR